MAYKGQTILSFCHGKISITLTIKPTGIITIFFSTKWVLFFIMSQDVFYDKKVLSSTCLVVLFFVHKKYIQSYGKKNYINRLEKVQTCVSK